MQETISTPYYLIDKQALRRNLQIIDYVREHSGAKLLLALKCFATWSVFDLMREHMDGTTSSSLYEVKLGYQKFGGETHAYSVAYADHEIEEAVLEGARTYQELQERTKLGTVCGQCQEEATELLKKYIAKHFGDNRK